MSLPTTPTTCHPVRRCRRSIFGRRRCGGGLLKLKRGYRPWLRFPQLDEGGSDKAKRDAVRAGMKARGIRHGYVTADGWDWYMESETSRPNRRAS